MVSHITIHDTNTCNYLLWRNLQLTHIYKIHWTSAKTDPLKAPLPPLANHCQVNLCTDAIEGHVQWWLPLSHCYITDQLLSGPQFSTYFIDGGGEPICHTSDPIFDAFGLDCKTLQLLSSALTTKPPHILPSSDKSAHLPK